MRQLRACALMDLRGINVMCQKFIQLVVSVEVKMLTAAIENVYPMAVMTNFANVVP
uniref:Uncharacterized protein n=1 Tax=Phlebotomus papatasi TaxID=29031 RepID=A0A1B0DAN0_PHLPP